jgi:predicted membrane-bound dolichyl-phosphate-mannose-protein mannosyltransferase
MLYLVLLPAALTLLFSAAERSHSLIYRGAVISFTGLYILGYTGLFIGLAVHTMPGLHIRLAELFYKTLAPLLMMGFAGWLCSQSPLKLGARLIGQV